MPTYKIILRDAENPTTSELHVIEDYCEAPNRTEAQKIFEERHGPRYIVAGPLKIEAPAT
jgi:hypothetical protein